tara:strand:+ start:279 stop:860 length:582 start_codon:yes stop_codon:yes gene_type:complete
MSRSRNLADLISGQSSLPYDSLQAGSVIQVKNVEINTTSETILSTAGAYELDAMSLAITPRFNNSKMLITGAFYMTPDSSAVVVSARLAKVVGGTTTVVNSPTTGSASSASTASQGSMFTVYSNSGITGTMGINQNTFFVLDTVSSTSEHTYKIQLTGNAASEIHFNQYGVAAVTYEDSWIPVSFMNIMEIRA